MSPPAKVEKKIQEVDPRSTLAGGDIAKSRIVEVDRETCTQGALHSDEQLCSIEDPTFHCKSASSALSGSTYLTMNKDHLSYGITLIA
ncbi:predicted protein [Lichtheimia corymbifera JMRC:FSU:9682]|uniref:Uncharacterized protein n=1 Tax=Lichtheimia corymbifera JMRC:FSU:9682 TaxID=1263082 RepID=A0A068S7Y5_9FUNG|nr:predicted protein [Lichtheimia corymbifera JMRC:FSU:9682]